MTAVPFLLFGRVRETMGPRKSSAALLIVCERNFYCLVRTILVYTKSGRVTEKGTNKLIGN